MTITIYGDSILKGILLVDGRYTVNHEWEDRYTQKYNIELRNMSHFGNTLEKGMKRMESDLSHGRLPGDFAVIGFGGNDCDFNWAEVAADPEGEHSCSVPQERFCALYRQAIHMMRQAGAEPVLVTPPPIDSERYLNRICRDGLPREKILQWLGDVNAIYRWQEMYARMSESIAAQEGTILVDLRTPILAKRRLGDYLCDDGIHPSRQGQQIIFDSLCAATEKILPGRNEAC